MRAASALIAGALGCGLLVLIGFSEPSVALRGWLIAFVFWSGIPIGALTLLMIRALTGGRWIAGAAPSLLAATAALPLLIPLFLPIALGLTLVYPWADATVRVPPDVARFYLNPAAYLARSGVALLGWSVLAILISRLAGPGLQLVAALGVLFHVLASSLIPVDWILSIDPSFTSTSFGAATAIGQLSAALAWALLFVPGNADRGVTEDLAGLLLATTLGVLYLDYMQYFVDWYGDLPPDAAWYGSRTSAGWSWLILAALLVGGLLPIAALLFRAVRRWPAALRLIGAAVLVGRLCHTAWLIGPSASPGGLAIGLIATAAIGGIWLGVAVRHDGRQELAHGT